MVSRLQKELRQTKPFASLEQEVILNLFRTAEYIASLSAAVLKSAGLTPTQYNVLRILRGAGLEGLTCSDISSRMITKDSDITRLLDRLDKRGLIDRLRPAEDRRTVVARITKDGSKLLADLDRPVHESEVRIIGHLGRQRLEALRDLLEAARDAEV